MLRCVLLESVLFQSAFKAIGEVVDEIQVQVDKEGWVVQAMDKSHISFICCQFKADFFEQYECPEPLTLNLDLEEFNKVLKRIDVKNEEVEFRYEGGDKDLIITLSDGLDDTSAYREFHIKPFDLEYTQPEPPKLEYFNHLGVGFNDFKKTLQDIELYSPTILLEYRPGAEELISCGEGFIGSAKIKQQVYAQEQGSLPGKSAFTLNPIKQFLKADKFSQTVFLRLGDDMPLSLEMKHEAVTNSETVASIRVLIAPRIESEEE
jgi:proliferating cell nuclear antigen